MSQTFGQFLRGHLEVRGWSYSDFAQRTGLHVSLISRVARDQRQPTLNMIQRCSEALEVPLVEAMAAAGKFEEAISATRTPEAAALSPYLQYAATPEGQEEIVARLPEKIDRVRRLEDPAGKLSLLLEWVGKLWDTFRNSSGTTKVLAGGALLYFLSPIDLVPDFIPLAGLMDDLAVVTLVVGLLMHQVPRPPKKDEP